MTLTALAAAVAGCSSARPQPGAAYLPASPTRPAATPMARTRSPAAPAVVLTGGTDDVLAARVARQLFSSAPVVVVASEDGPAARTAAAEAERVHAPLLLTAATAPANRTAATPAAPATAVDPAVRREVGRLHPRAVLAVGLAAGTLAAGLPGVRVVSDPAVLPATAAPPPLSHVAVLLPRGTSAPALAVTATAQVAGATVVAMRGADPRADPAAIAALAQARPRHVVAVGAGFGSAARLAERVAVAATGTQLPGGGQVLFPGHRLVALYGHPGSPALGVLGQQDLAASIARARKMAAAYRSLSDVPVVPTFEIIATVALGSPGPEGTYSAVSSVASLRPWVDAATAAGFYVVLDLQPGRASLLDQAKVYEPLLRRPNVGLALDPEWKLQPGQMPLRQIGSVGIDEVNGVVGWLAGLTARYHLPQKLLVLHQFRLSMIRGEQDLDTGNDDLAIVLHMDGQGTPGVKDETWKAVTGAAPRGVWFGWKNFYTKDHPMLSPQQTMTNVPAPVMISYQ